MKRRTRTNFAVQNFKKYDLNLRWFCHNYSVIKDQCGGKYVAISDEKIIDSDLDFKLLNARLNEKRIQLNQVLVKHVSKNDEFLIRLTRSTKYNDNKRI
jgi:hypothetical protein